MTDLPPDLQQLLARAAKIELFAIFMTPTDKFQPPQRRPRGHLPRPGPCWSAASRVRAGGI
jgi:hypothetical protein